MPGWTSWDDDYDSQPATIAAGWQGVLIHGAIVRAAKIHGGVRCDGRVPSSYWTIAWLARQTGAPVEVVEAGMLGCERARLVSVDGDDAVIAGWRGFTSRSDSADRVRAFRSKSTVKRGVTVTPRYVTDVTADHDHDHDHERGGRAPAPAPEVPRADHLRTEERASGAAPAEDRGDAPLGQGDPGETAPRTRAPKPRPPADPRHTRFRAWWCEHYPAAHDGQPYRFDGAKDNTIVKALLGLFPSEQSEQLAAAVRRAWSGERDWWAEKATTLAGFRSIAQEVAAAPARNGTAVQVRRRISSDRDLDELEAQFYRYGLDKGMTPDRALAYGVERAAERRAAAPKPA